MAHTITHNKNSTVTISGEIPFEKLESHRAMALKHLGEHVGLPGFRKGHAPEHMLTAHLGEAAILEEMAERALVKELPGIFAEHAVVPLGKPHVSITKLAPKNPLGFKLETPMLPKIVLPDTKAITKNIPILKPEEITEKEVETVIHEIRHRLYHREMNTKEGGHEHKPDEKLPELTDELVMKLGDYKNVADFTEKLKAELKMRKMYEMRDKRRSEILDEIVKNVDAVLPDILVDSELSKMLGQFRGDVERAGMKFQDYLSQAKKTEDDLQREWRADAEKRAKSQLVLSEIARAENIHPDEKEVEARVNEILSENPNAPKDSLRIYIETILTNEKVFQFLEQQNILQDKKNLE